MVIHPYLGRSTASRGVRHLMRGTVLALAGLTGWFTACHWVQAQDLWVPQGPKVVSSSSMNWPEAYPTAFWICPNRSTVGGQTYQAPRIQKTPFRYGDFGARSYPLRQSSSNYYQSRTDWGWP